MKKIPMRRCLATNEMCPKKDLLRVVKNNEGKVFFDYSSKANGRGAYICCSSECLKKSMNNKGLERTLKTSIPKEIFVELEKELSKTDI